LRSNEGCDKAQGCTMMDIAFRVYKHGQRLPKIKSSDWISNLEGILLCFIVSVMRWLDLYDYLKIWITNSKDKISMIMGLFLNT